MLKKLFAVMLSAVMIISVLPLSLTAFAEDVTTGSCGPDATWTLDPDASVLTISGTGELYEENVVQYPAIPMVAETLIVEEGITYIPDFFFSRYYALKSVQLPDTLKTIGDSAFNSCTSLESVVIPDSVTAIYYGSVFVGCTSLKTAKLGDGLGVVSERMFEGCTSLESVTLPNYRDITICADAFKNCPALTDIYYGGTLAEWSGEYTDSFGDKYPYVEIREGNDILKSVTVHPINGGECQHVFESETIPASCIHGGYTLYTCTLCGYSYTDNETGVIDHSYGDWIVTVQPTCIYPGEKYRVCSVCNNEEWVDLKPLGHSATSVMVKNPTVDEEGEMQSVCTTCGKVLSTAVIPKLIDDRTRGITLSSEKEMLLTGESVTLTASIIPDTATNKNVIWTSSDTSVATVDNGTVSAVNTGAAVIVAKTEDTGYTAFCLVQVFSVNAVNGAHLDNSTGFIYGLTPNLDSVADYLELDDESVSITYSADVIGTGTVIEVKQNETTIKTYQAVIFGDVNGDGIYDGQDAFIVNCIATGALTREQVGEAKYLAADCNHDGLVDSSDVMILQKAGVLLAQVNQSESDTDIEEKQAYQDYIELIDQNPAAEDQPVEEPEPVVQPASLIDRIIEFIKKVVDFFRSIISKF